MNKGKACMKLAAASLCAALTLTSACATPFYVFGKGYVNIRMGPRYHASISGKAYLGEEYDYDKIGIDIEGHEWYRTPQGFIKAGYTSLTPITIVECQAKVSRIDTYEYEMADTNSFQVKRRLKDNILDVIAYNEMWALTADGYYVRMSDIEILPKKS